MNYGSAWGLPELRKALAAYLGRARGIDCDYNNVLITSGSQQGLWLAASLLAKPGDRVLVEDPCYLGARSVLTGLGARTIPVPVDREGIVPAALEKAALEEPAPKLLYLTPANQYPTGVALSAARRMEVLQLAARRGFMVIEDDYDSEYRFEGRPLRSLAGIDTAGVVCYLGSFSKVLFPALRVGYVVGPKWLLQAMAALRWHVDFMPSTLEGAALAQFISEGHFERHLRRMRTLYAEKRVAFVAAVRRLMPQALPDPLPPGGMRLALNVPARMSREEALRRAMDAGVRLFDLSGCYADEAQAPAQLTMGFTAVSVQRLVEAAERIARAWRG
jgi:GntR family transcriptional regulator/MocR family aminotransferase